jgi:PPOX class probable FMN-dependent enzyme
VDHGSDGGADGGAVTTAEALAALYGPTLPASVTKVMDHLGAPYRAFVEAAPFVVLATVGPGGVDVSPRGDPPGFVAVADPRTLLIPDRRGNNRLDALRNILTDPRVSLLFVIPGVGETVRVAGRAEIRADAGLRARFALDGRLPATVLRVSVEKVYYQCRKAVVRARLWDPSARVDAAAVPSVGAMIACASAETVDAGATDAAYLERQKTLY